MPEYKNLPATNAEAEPAGNNQEIQINQSGSFGSDPSLKWDESRDALNLNGMFMTALSSTVSLVDNQPANVNIPGLTWNASTYHYTVIEYSLERNGEYQFGRFMIANSTTVANISNDFQASGDTGINFFATIIGGNVFLQYTSTNTGFNGFFRYSMRQW